MKKVYSLLIVGVISFFMVLSCSKSISKETDDWGVWLGLKELMGKAGFDTNGITVFDGYGEGWRYLPDTRSVAHAWCGKKNGEAWVGLGHAPDAFSGWEDTTFDAEFIWKGHTAPEKETFDAGYGQTLEGTYVGVGAGFVLLDKDFYWLQLFDRYDTGYVAYKKMRETMFFVDNGTVSAQLDGFIIERGFLVGYDHDLLINDACYSKTGEKLYEIVNSFLKENYSRWMFRVDGYISISTPVDHKNFIIVTYPVYASFDIGIDVLFCDMSAEKDYVNVRKEIPGLQNEDRIDSFELVSVVGNVYSYELVYTKYSGERVVTKIKADNGTRTVELE